MTLSQLAKIANVSVSTVSKAFSDSSEISKETKEMIIKLSKEYGCYEKYFKPKYNKKLIAVICPELLGVHYSRMVSYIENDVTSRGGTVLISVTNFSQKAQSEFIDYYINFAHVDGIIVIEPVAKIKNDSDVPIIQIGLSNDSGNVHSITMDITSALDEAILLLKNYGHTKFGFIGEEFTTSEFDFLKTYLNKNSLEVNDQYISINSHRFYDCGYYGIDELIKKKSLPSVVFAAYSHIAIGVLQRLNEEHLKVPDDISVVCMDDINISPYADIDLTCIRIHLEELCREAIHLLYRIFAKRYTILKHTITVERKFHQGKSIKNISRSELKNV